MSLIWHTTHPFRPKPFRKSFNYSSNDRPTTAHLRAISEGTGFLQACRFFKNNFSWFPDICVEVARHTPIDDTVPRSSYYEKIKRVSEEEFNEYFNGNYTALQEVNIQGGDYFLERSDNDDVFIFHAFFEKPSRHFRICCGQTIGGSDFSLMRENTISARPMTKKRGLHITEEVFCLAYKIVLEFLYSGSAMPGSQDKAFQAIKGLLAPNSKPMEVVVTQESYYKKARGLMLQRKDEI